MADYYTLLTNAGIAYETACKANGTPIKLTQMSVGDGAGTVYNPDATAVALRREVWRGSINALMQDAKNLSWLLAEVTIPNEVGGWYVREAGIWTDTGILYAVIKYPESFKPVMADQGAGKEFYIRAIFQTSNAANVVLSIDDSIVKATRAWVAEYVQGELAKLDAKKSVRAAATGPITLRDGQLCDDVAVIAGDSVAAFFQANPAENGIYIVANGAWSRRADADVSAEVTPNLLVSIEEGTKYADTLWQLTTNAPIVLGTTALKFEMVSGPTGISPGTYRQVVVDRRGLVIGGTNPTSLAGYGIADAYSKTEADGRYPTTENTSAVGFSLSDPEAMYMRRRSDGLYFFVQRKLSFTPVQQGTGVGQLANVVKIGWSTSGLKATVDAQDMGVIWTGSNFDPNSKANWGSSLAAYGITNAYTKTEVDSLVGGRAAWSSSLAGYGITNAYTKTEVDSQVTLRALADSITYVGLSANDISAPYLRRSSDSSICWLQPKLGYVPVQQGTGVGQLGNLVKLGWSGTNMKLTVDTGDLGNLWYSANFDPNSKANWGTTLAAYGITNAYTKAETDARDSQRPLADSITTVGFASNDPTTPYMRRASDGTVYYLQTRLGFAPIEQGGGANQLANKLRIGYNGAGSVRLQVDSTDFGDLISDQNIGTKIAGLGLNAIGSYAFATVITDAGRVNQGGLIAGTNLRYGSTNVSDGNLNNSGGIGVGTWRAHGAFSTTERTLFQRVS